MTKGINWVATTRTLTGNRINNVPNISPNQEPHIRNLLRRLYHSKMKDRFVEKILQAF